MPAISLMSVFRGPAAAIVAAVVALAAAPQSALAALYAVTNTGLVFESTNDGVSWAEKGQIAEPDVAALSPGLTSGVLFAVGATGTTYRSVNAGASWTAVGSVGAADCVALAVGRSGALHALTRTGVLSRSSDSGASWTAISVVGASDCSALAVGGKAGANDTLFVVTESGDVSRSPTGAAWTTVGTIGYTPVVDLLWITKTLYALSDAGEVLRSSNSGVAWTPIGTISQVGMRALAHAGGKLKAVTAEGEVYESATGASWSSSWIGATNQVYTVAFAAGLPEFTTGVGGPDGETPSLALRAWPNPFRERVLLRLDGSPTNGAFMVEVFDASGRNVRRLSSADGGELDWSGDADDGRSLGPGNYFLRVSTERQATTSRVVLLR